MGKIQLCYTYPKAVSAGLDPGEEVIKMRLNVQEIYWRKYLLQKLGREPEEVQRALKLRQI